MGVVELGRRSLTFALGGLAYKGVALLTLPVLARILTPAQLGLLDLAAVLATLVGLVAILGTDQGVAFLEPRSEHDAQVWSSALLLLTVLAGAGVAGAVLFGSDLAAFMTGDAGNGPLVVAAALYGWVVALTITALNAIRLHATPRTYAVASFVVVTAEMSAALFVAWRLESPVPVMVLAWAAAALVVSLPLLARYIPNLGTPRASTMHRLISFGVPLVPAAVAWLIGDAWIRGTVARSLELGALGEYGIASRITSVAVLAATGFAVAWQPYIFRSPAREMTRRTEGTIVAVIMGLGVIAAVLTLLSPEIVGVIAGDRYAGASSVVAPLAGGAIAFGTFSLLAGTTAASGVTRRVGLAAVIGMTVQMATVGLFVAGFGLVGAGLASVLGYVAAVGTLLPSHRSVLTGSAGRALAVAVISVVLVLVLADLSHVWPTWMRLVLALAAVTTTAVTLLVRRKGGW